VTVPIGCGGRGARAGLAGGCLPLDDEDGKAERGEAGAERDQGPVNLRPPVAPVTAAEEAGAAGGEGAGERRPDHGEQHRRAEPGRKILAPRQRDEPGEIERQRKIDADFEPEAPRRLNAQTDLAAERAAAGGEAAAGAHEVNEGEEGEEGAEPVGEAHRAGLPRTVPGTRQARARHRR